MELPMYKGRKDLVNVGDTERVISAVGGGALALAALAKPRPASLPLLGLASYLVYRGATGFCLTYKLLGINRSDTGLQGVAVEQATTVYKPVEEVYAFWRSFDNLPRFMNHLESVQVFSNNRSHWVAKGPLGSKVTWDAEIVADEPNAYIAWRSLPGSTVENAGWVRFRAAPGSRGTEIFVQMEYNPPAGSAGAAVAKLLGEEPNRQIREDLQRFKRIMETGEVVTVDGQTSGRAASEGG